MLNTRYHRYIVHKINNNNNWIYTNEWVQKFTHPWISILWVLFSLLFLINVFFFLFHVVLSFRRQKKYKCNFPPVIQSTKCLMFCCFLLKILFSIIKQTIPVLEYDWSCVQSHCKISYRVQLPLKFHQSESCGLLIMLKEL